MPSSAKYPRRKVTGKSERRAAAPKKEPFAQICEAVQKRKKRKRKPRGKPFREGPDPRRNLGGVPPEVREIRDALRLKGLEYVKALERATKNGNWAAAVKALEWILGKPTQPVELGGGAKPIEIRDVTDRLLARINSDLAARGASPADSTLKPG